MSNTNDPCVFECEHHGETIEGGLRVTPSRRMIVLGIDPGTTQSAYVRFDCSEENSEARMPWPLLDFGIIPNEEMGTIIDPQTTFDAFAIEMIESFGKPVGREVFQTCTWIGAFEEQCRTYKPGIPMRRYSRHQVKMHHCHAAQGVTDGVIRQALIDRFGGRVRAIGTVKNPGPLHGVANDVWSALAIAVKFCDDYRTPF